MPQDGSVPQRGPSGAPGLPNDMRRRPAVPSAVIGVMMFVAAEAMFFAGLISAFLVVKAGIKPGMWPPPWQPRLPVEVTGVNTAILVVSGLLMLAAGRVLVKNGVVSVPLYLAATALGATFVGVQGYEWSQLLSQGLTMTSSNHGAFFYLIVGTHALHVVAGLMALVWGALRLRKGTLTVAQRSAIQIFWTFVVGLWPILYSLVYL
jgi:heme/copper-type cytochrome/quinol oxidase subunit 3